MSISQLNPRILAAFAAIYVLWGSTYLAVAVAVTSIPPFLLMGSRSLAGGLVLFLYAKRNGASAPVRSWLIAGACGLLFFVGCHGVLAFAQQRVPSGVAAIILATIPFWIALIGFVIPAEKPVRPWTLVLLVPGLTGVALIAWRQLATGQAALQLSDILLLLASSFSWALGSVLSERHSSQETSAVALSGMALIVGGAALLVLSAGLGEIRLSGLAAPSAASLLAWAYLTLAGTVVAFASYVWLLERISPTLVGTYTFVNPIIAVLLGWAILGEPLTASMLGGGALVVGSIIGLLAADRASPAKPKRATHDAQPLSALQARTSAIGSCSSA
jgi:drug/metabolite transporter (DMT)-like permease